MSLDRFLIADNPMRDGGTTAIIHQLDPRAIIHVHEGHVTTAYPYRHYVYKQFPLPPELYTLSLYHCMVHTFDGEAHNIIIEKLLNNAWHWFMAYKAWEDQQIHYEED